MVRGSPKYRLGARIGGGGMAEVFAATLVGAEGFSRPVAIKRMLPGLSADPGFADMFVNEAQLASRLSHPNVVAVLDFDRDADGQLFLVMELVEGVDLRELGATGPIPRGLGAFVIAEVLRALAYAHELERDGRRLGLVHRDVSPHNVLVSYNGAVKLSDFGIAKAMAASAASRSGSLKGKVAYMSPEQAHGLPLDGRSDLFAVGVMLHELLTGARLFAGGTEAEVLGRVLSQRIAPPHELDPAIDEDLSAVCMGLLERDRDRRFAHAGAALEALLNAGVVSPRAQLDLARLMEARLGPAQAGPQVPAATQPREPDPRKRIMMMAETRSVLGPPPAPAPPGGTVTATPADSPSDPRPRGSRAPTGRFAVLVALSLAAGATVVAVLDRSPTDSSSPVTAREAAAPRDPVGTAASQGVTETADTTSASAADALGGIARDPSSWPDAGATGAPRGHRSRPPREGTARAPSPPAEPAGAVAPGGEAVARPDRRRATLRVLVDPWAEVDVDGRASGTTPLDLTLSPGRHTIVLRNDDRDRDETVLVELPSGGEHTIRRRW